MSNIRYDIIFISSIIVVSILSTILGFSISIISFDKNFIYSNSSYTRFISSLYSFSDHILTIKIGVSNITDIHFYRNSNRSHSMGGVFSAHSGIIVAKLENPNLYNIGDIIVFVDNDTLVAHRIIYKGFDDKGVYYITQGDANKIPDKIIRVDDIIGVVITILY